MGLLAQARRLMPWAEAWVYKLDKALKDEVLDTTTVLDMREVRFEGNELHAYMGMGTELGTGIRNRIKIVLPFSVTPIPGGVQVLWGKPPEVPPEDPPLRVLD